MEWEKAAANYAAQQQAMGFPNMGQPQAEYYGGVRFLFYVYQSMKYLIIRFKTNT